MPCDSRILCWVFYMKSIRKLAGRGAENLAVCKNVQFRRIGTFLNRLVGILLLALDGWNLVRMRTRWMRENCGSSGCRLSGAAGRKLL